jgi:predicted RNA-binding protein YlqC (UPF0109 family)
MSLDFRTATPAEKLTFPPEQATPAENLATPSDRDAVARRLKDFLQFVVVNLIGEPESARMKVTDLKPSGLRFTLILEKKDVALLIGKDGQTAAAIRGLLKAAAALHGVQALLQIHSHEDEMAFVARQEAER